MEHASFKLGCSPLNSTEEYSKTYVNRPKPETVLAAAIQNALSLQNKGIVSIRGFDGVGKTTLVNKVLSDLERDGNLLCVTVDVSTELILEQDVLSWFLTNIVYAILHKKGKIEKFIEYVGNDPSTIPSLANNVLALIIGTTNPWLGLVNVILKIIKNIHERKRAGKYLPTDRLVSEIISESRSDLIKLRERHDGLVIAMDDIANMHSSIRFQFLQILKKLMQVLRSCQECIPIVFLVVWKETDVEQQTTHRMITPEEDDFLQQFTDRITLGPMEDIDQLSMLVQRLKFSLESPNVIHIIKKKTQGRPRKVCIVLNWLKNEFHTTRISVELANKIPDDYVNQLSLYIHAVLVSFEPQLYCSSIVPEFTLGELKLLLAEYFGQNKDSGYVETLCLNFIKSQFVTNTHSPDRYSINSDYAWISESIRDSLMSSEQIFRLTTAIITYFRKGTEFRDYLAISYHEYELLQLDDAGKLKLQDYEREKIMRELMNVDLTISTYLRNPRIIKYAQVAYDLALKLDDRHSALIALSELFPVLRSTNITVEQIDELYKEAESIYANITESKEGTTILYCGLALNYALILSDVGQYPKGMEIIRKISDLIGEEYESRNISDLTAWCSLTLRICDFCLTFSLDTFDGKEAKNWLTAFQDTLAILCLNRAASERAGSGSILESMAHIEYYASRLKSLEGDFEKSLSHAEESLKLFEKLQSYDSISILLRKGYLELLMYRYVEAYEDIKKASTIFQNNNDYYWGLISSLIMAICCIALGKTSECREQIEEAIQLKGFLGKKFAGEPIKVTKAYLEMVTQYYALVCSIMLVARTLLIT